MLFHLASEALNCRFEISRQLVEYHVRAYDAPARHDHKSTSPCKHSAGHRFEVMPKNTMLHDCTCTAQPVTDVETAVLLVSHCMSYLQPIGCSDAVHTQTSSLSVCGQSHVSCLLAACRSCTPLKREVPSRDEPPWKSERDGPARRNARSGGMSRALPGDCMA